VLTTIDIINIIVNNSKESQMNKEELKKISVQVSKKCLKSLKIRAIHKDLSLGEYIRKVLEESISSKKNLFILEEEK
jgi:predicted DNA binding CopG/RHH family protein